MPFQGRDRSIQMYLHNEKVCSNFSQPHMTSTDGNHRMGKKNFKNSLTESTSSGYIYTINTGKILAYTPSWWRSPWWLDGFIILAALDFYVVWLSFWATPRQPDKQDPWVSKTANMFSVPVKPFLPVAIMLPPKTEMRLWDSQTRWSCLSTFPCAYVSSVRLYQIHTATAVSRPARMLSSTSQKGPWRPWRSCGKYEIGIWTFVFIWI